MTPVRLAFGNEVVHPLLRMSVMPTPRAFVKQQSRSNLVRKSRYHSPGLSKRHGPQVDAQTPATQAAVALVEASPQSPTKRVTLPPLTPEASNLPPKRILTKQDSRKLIEIPPEASNVDRLEQWEQWKERRTRMSMTLKAFTGYHKGGAVSKI